MMQALPFVALVVAIAVFWRQEFLIRRERLRYLEELLQRQPELRKYLD